MIHKCKCGKEITGAKTVLMSEGHVTLMLECSSCERTIHKMYMCFSETTFKNGKVEENKYKSID